MGAKQTPSQMNTSLMAMARLAQVLWDMVTGGMFTPSETAWLRKNMGLAEEFVASGTWQEH